MGGAYLGGEPFDRRLMVYPRDAPAFNRPVYRIMHRHHAPALVAGGAFSLMSTLMSAGA